MKFKSPIVTEASGKLGNTVAAQGRNGLYMRNKVSPTNPRTQAQSDVRAAFTTNSQAWRGLTEDQRTGFHALGMQITTSDSLGNKSTLTGSQIHQGLNGVLATMGAAPISNAPSQPDAIAALPTITLEAARVGTASGAFSLFVRSAAYAGKVQVYATPAVSAGRNTFGKSSFRLLEVVDGLTNGGTPLTEAYTAKYGAPQLGSKIAVMLVPVSPTGFKGSKYHAIGIVSIGS